MNHFIVTDEPMHCHGDAPTIMRLKEKKIVFIVTSIFYWETQLLTSLGTLDITLESDKRKNQSDNLLLWHCECGKIYLI